MLTSQAIGVLEQFKVRLIERRREQEGLTAISVEQIHEAAEAQQVLDAKEYAAWAGRQLAEMVKGQHENPVATLKSADFCYLRMLRRGYLVQVEFLQHAYETAVRLAGKKD